MAKFNRFDNQKAIAVEAKASGSALDLVVGDMVSYIPATNIAAKVTKKSQVSTALGAGYLVLLVAQGEAVTNKTGTAYKTYKIGNTIQLPTDSTKILIGYNVTDPSNIDGYAAE